LTLTKELEQFVRKEDVDLFGVAPLERFKNAPTDRHPSRYLDDTVCIISLGIRLNKAVVNNLPNTRRSYEAVYRTSNARLNELALSVARFLEERGYRAVNIPASDPYKKAAYAGDLSHRHVAQAAGLGEFGLNNLLLTPRYGPRVRFVSVITNAPLESSPLLKEHICTECRTCIKSCPSGALSVNLDSHDWTVGRRIHYGQCNDYMVSALDGLECGMCIKACPIGS